MAKANNWRDPLGDYLAPRFAVLEPRTPWTTDLTAAVRGYLLFEDDLASTSRWAQFRQLLWHEPPVRWPRAQQAEFIIEHHTPYEIQDAVRLLAALTLPMLDDLIGHLDAWSLEFEIGAAYWLMAHATSSQMTAMAQAAPAAVRGELDTERKLTPDDLIDVLSPPALLRAWHTVVEQPSGNLTDAE
jgi:hypothetical protein